MSVVAYGPDVSRGPWLLGQRSVLDRVLHDDGGGHALDAGQADLAPR
ncbi:hypothetical protein GZL_00204 [Streptomyces sp. 769]|nr:hypothetical protein GZL_00204 [Streptomyces sp. 769]